MSHASLFTSSLVRCLLGRFIIRRLLEGDIAQHGHSSAGHTVLRRGGILGLEQNSGAQGRGGQVLRVLETTALVAQSALEDAHILNLHLLAQSDEMAQGEAQLIQYCDAVRTLHRSLGLDEVRQLSRGDMLLVIQ